MDNREFTEKRVVITGAGSGIGRATALAFATQGASLILLDRSQTGLDETVAQLPEGSTAATILCDVSRVSEIEAAFGEIEAEHGEIDILVNNAGINPAVPTSLDIDESFYDEVMDVNAKGIFFCAREALRSMIASEKGVIVNLGSVSGMIGWGGSSIYSASKGAVIALTKALAMEVAPHGIRVNAICPGTVRTPMVANVIDARPDPEAGWAASANFHPLGRVAEPSDIANGILYLASDRSSFVTGTTLVVDGGLTAR
ncbi:MAG TPA: SDR family NAD(P)-dependent oxidoreductase [Thermomicrobiales bacterium]|nr:SDR family NAD(P)-dependent oxidoreductase [Thermomicrobiales bacterium]